MTAQALKAHPVSGSKEWHDDRRKGIGGSDCAAALGLSKFKTPYQLYQEKIGEAQAEDETWEMLRGKAMEPALRQHYANKTGREVIMPKGALVHPKYAFMRYNPDGLSNDNIRLQEFKTATYSKEWGEVGSDEIPQEYLLQVQHGMIVCQRQVADVSVSVGGNKPKYFEVEADKELQEMIIEQEAAFWDLVQARRAPPPSSNDDVVKMFNTVNGQSIIASPEASESLFRLLLVRESIKNMEADKEGYEVIIKAFMGEYEVLVDEGMTPLVTWKQQKGATRIDSDRLKSEQPVIAAEYSKTGEPIRRLLLK